MKTKIEWCNMTWNPVWGCKNKCVYCYARKINNRFKKIENWNNPEWIEQNFQKSFPSSPSKIFVNSMSDVAYWNEDWMDRVINKIEQFPELNFLFLTKNYDIYANYYFPENCWLGYTIVNQAQYDNFLCNGYYPENNLFFLSIEPIQDNIQIDNIFDWLIVGAETGNRKTKVVPKKKWIDNLLKCDIPVFMKDNLKQYWNGELKQDFPF